MRTSKKNPVPRADRAWIAIRALTLLGNITLIALERLHIL
jgi:hypothetical protein